MRIQLRDLLAFVFILLISFFLTFDLFFVKGQAATFDGQIHVTMTAQFYHALTQGETRVTWADGFGNYGMPMPLIHQQTAAYFGALLNFIFQNVVLSTNIVFFIGGFLACLFLYIFLRLYVSNEAALAGTFFYCFGAYRIINIYLRGALPEFFATAFIPLALIGLYFSVIKKKLFGFFIFVIAIALIIVSHPFILIIGLFIIIPYLGYLLYLVKFEKKRILLVLVGFFFAFGITSYYTIPLFTEIKYFYYGLDKSHFTTNQFLSLSHYINPQWGYFGKDSFFVRNNFLQLGILETIVLISGLGFAFYNLFRKTYTKHPFFFLWVGIGLVYLFFTSQWSEFIYTHSSLSNIQHPWRMLTGLSFVSAVLLAYLANQVKHKTVFLIVVITIVSLLRFPQLYTKNSSIYPQSSYFFTQENLAAVVLNPIWAADPLQYPIKRQKAEIIDGKGKILSQKVKNSSRIYSIDAVSDIRMVDYTFYFPGWNVYVDGKKTSIEFQDPTYRGVITYAVPRGKHIVFLKFENTKPRTLGLVISFISLVLFLSIIVLFKIRKKV